MFKETVKDTNGVNHVATYLDYGPWNRALFVDGHLVMHQINQELSTFKPSANASVLVMSDPEMTTTLFSETSGVLLSPENLTNMSCARCGMVKELHHIKDDDPFLCAGCL